MSELFEFIPEILTTAKMVMDTVDNIKFQACPPLYCISALIGAYLFLRKLDKFISRKHHP